MLKKPPSFCVYLLPLVPSSICLCLMVVQPLYLDPELTCKHLCPHLWYKANDLSIKSLLLKRLLRQCIRTTTELYMLNNCFHTFLGKGFLELYKEVFYQIFQG